MKLPTLHSPALCRSGGDTCGDYVCGADGTCQHFGHIAVEDEEGVFAAPECRLAYFAVERIDKDIGAELACTREYAGDIATAAMLKLRKRAKLARLHEALDHDAFAETRKPLALPDDEDPIDVTGPVSRTRVLAQLASGLTRPADIARAIGCDASRVAAALSRLADSGLARRVRKGVWLPVQYAKEAS